MTPYRKGGFPGWMITITTKDGRYVRRSAGTRDKGTAAAIEQMFAVLGRRGSRDWGLVDAVVAKELAPPVLYDHYLRGTLEVLRARLDDTDLAPFVDEWERTLDVADETRRKYVAQVAVLFRKDAVGVRLPFLRSAFTRASVTAALQAIPKAVSRQRHRAAWLSVIHYLIERDAIQENPLALTRTKRGKRTDKEPQFLDGWALVEEFVRAYPSEKHRAIAALRHGAGVEFSAAVKVTRESVQDWANRVVYVVWTKNQYRRRPVVVKPWAWAILEPVLRTAFPGAKVLYATEKNHDTAHRQAVDELRARGRDIPAKYTLHNARHSYAVNAVKGGDAIELVQHNLGHATLNETLRVYGRYRPTVVDMVRASQRTG